MLAFSDIIDFLLRLMSDEAAQAQFEQDPQGTLEQAGLEGVTAQDIRDARLQLADSGAVSATDDGSGSSYPDGDDPVREIGYTTQHYAVDEDVRHDDDGGADLSQVDRTTTFVTIDDRDTLFFQSISDDDVTVTDNSVNIVTAIQDNDTSISDDDVSITADGSFNSDNDVVAVQDNSVDVDLDGPADPPAPAPDVDEPEADDPDEAPSADLAAVSGPAEPDEPTDDVEVDDEPADADLAADDSSALAV